MSPNYGTWVKNLISQGSDFSICKMYRVIVINSVVQKKALATCHDVSSKLG